MTNQAPLPGESSSKQRDGYGIGQTAVSPRRFPGVAAAVPEPPAATPTDLEALIQEVHGLSAAMADVNALMADLNELLLMAPAAPDWKTDLAVRLSSRKFWAFIVGLLTVIVTAWQGSPDPRFTVSAVVVATVGYIAAQSHTDAAQAKSTHSKQP